MTINKQHAPSHPGKLLREVVLPAMQVTVTRAAKEMGISRQQLHKILAEKRAVTPEMAVRIGKYAGNGAGLWLRMQQAYDLWHAERNLAKDIKKIPTRDAA